MDGRNAIGRFGTVGTDPSIPFRLTSCIIGQVCYIVKMSNHDHWMDIDKPRNRPPTPEDPTAMDIVHWLFVWLVLAIVFGFGGCVSFVLF